MVAIRTPRGNTPGCLCWDTDASVKVIGSRSGVFVGLFCVCGVRRRKVGFVYEFLSGCKDFGWGRLAAV